MTTATRHANAVELLKEDHRKVKELFHEFEGSADRVFKQGIAEKVFKELKLHATIEEELFYPAVEDAADAKQEVDHAREEHERVKEIMEELETLPVGDEFDTKFKVMAENVRHHIEEEEGRMLPQAEASGIDMQALGGEMAELKRQAEAGPPERTRRKIAGGFKRAHSKARRK